MNPDATPLLLAIIGHLVGDYILQNDWMANGKKVRSWPCVIHCLLWTFAVCVFAEWFAPAVVAWLFLTHFAIDRTQFIAWWMDNKGQAGFRQFAGPWSSIVVDNVWHILTLWAAWRFIA